MHQVALECDLVEAEVGGIDEAVASKVCIFENHVVFAG